MSTWFINGHSHAPNGLWWLTVVLAGTGAAVFWMRAAREIEEDR